MNDFERLLKNSLQDAGSDFEPEDLHASRREFIEARRRRRITGFVSGLAVAGAATAAVLFVASSGVQTPQESPNIAPAFAPRVLQTIPVGVEPTGVTVDDAGIVWVANSGDSSVSRVGPRTGTAETIALPGAPGDVSATTSYVYAIDAAGDTPAGTTGSATVLDRVTGALAARDNPDDIPDGPRAQLFGGVFSEGPDSDLGHIDAMASGDALWASSAAKAGVSVNYDDGSVELFPDVPASEIAVLDGTGFALDPKERLLYPLVPGSSVPVQALEISADVVFDGDGNLDMAGGLGSLWIVQGDVLYRIDPESGRSTGRVDLDGGDYAAVTTGQGYVWVLESTVDEHGGGRLYKIDPDTAIVVGAPLVLEGKLADVAAGGGSVWVTSKDTNSVLRISPSGLAE